MKILISMPSIRYPGLCVPWLEKFKYFQSHGGELYISDSRSIKLLSKINNIYSFNNAFFHFTESHLSKFEYLIHCLVSNLKSLFFLKKASNLKFDIIYSPSAVLDFIIFAYFYKTLNKKCKWLVNIDNTVPLKNPGNPMVRFLTWVFFQISLMLMSKSDHIFAVSPDIKEYLIKCHFSADQITVTGNGLEIGLIKRAKIIKKYKSDALFIGRINDTKGIYDMLEILLKIKDKYPNFLLNIMGNGDPTTLQNFKRQIIKHGLSHNIKLLGYRQGQEKFNFIKSSRSFWFFSVSESFGVALLEAVTSGLFAFTYDLPAFRYIYKHNEIYTFKIKDYQTIVDKMLSFYQNKKYINTQGKKLLNKYSWENIAKHEYQTMIKDQQII